MTQQATSVLNPLISSFILGGQESKLMVEESTSAVYVQCGDQNDEDIFRCGGYAT
jgi:hypothetical protein